MLGRQLRSPNRRPENSSMLKKRVGDDGTTVDMAKERTLMRKGEERPATKQEGNKLQHEYIHEMLLQRR